MTIAREDAAKLIADLLDGALHNGVMISAHVGSDPTTVWVDLADATTLDGEHTFRLPVEPA